MTIGDGGFYAQALPGAVLFALGGTRVFVAATTAALGRVTQVANTGTPAGVALGRGARAYRRAGDVVEVEIDGLGRQRRRMGQA